MLRWGWGFPALPIKARTRGGPRLRGTQEQGNTGRKAAPVPLGLGPPSSCCSLPYSSPRATGQADKCHRDGLSSPSKHCGGKWEGDQREVAIFPDRLCLDTVPVARHEIPWLGQGWGQLVLRIDVPLIPFCFPLRRAPGSR